MKLAFIRQKYVTYGGAESFLDRYTRALAEAGHEIHIFANQWTRPEHPRIQVHSVGAVKLNAFVRTLSFAWRAAQALRPHSFDVVQSHERTFAPDVYRAGDGCHREWLERRQVHVPPVKRVFLWCSPFHRLILALEKNLFAADGCRKIIAISEMVKRDIQKHYGTPDERIAVVYNGVPLERFHPRNRDTVRDPVRKQLQVPEDAVVMLFVGSGFERKGLKFLLQATRYFKPLPWRLVLIGKGDWKGSLVYAPREAQKKILCLDPRDDLENYYAAADVFVLPSIYEPFGNANLEALASGLPVVTSRASGAAEIITPGENGMVIEDPSDPKEIAAHLNILMNPSLRERMGEKARLLAEQFTWERTVREMLRVYEDVKREKISSQKG